MEWRFAVEQMELHVLGPAFGLVSIDAECVASVALLRLNLPDGWRIIPTHDQSRRLPYLQDGEHCIDGFKNIVKHVEQRHSTSTTPLDQKQRADATALSSFIGSHAQTLLDISLYVSFENYSATRSAYTKILPWYANYILPPKRRQEARMRTEHLGISSIDIDDVHEDLSNRPSGFDLGKEKTFEAETQKRASLLLPQRNTVRSLLQRPQHSAVFKLHALAENFFGPLQDMLGDSEYLLGASEPHAIDCLAYGYLSLMLYPQLPQDWLAKTMRNKYPKLARYTERVHEKLQLQTNVEEVMLLAECTSRHDVDEMRASKGMVLPWSPPARTDVLDVATTITRDLVSRVPLFGSNTELIHATGIRPTFVHRYLPAMLVATATTIGLFGNYAFATGVLVWPRGQELQVFGRKRLADYGAIGAALGGVSLLGRQATQDITSVELQQRGNPPRAEVEVEKDGVP